MYRYADFRIENKKREENNADDGLNVRVNCAFSRNGYLQIISKCQTSVSFEE